MAQQLPPITPEDRAKHDQQFFSLKPVNGFITGEQARGFFMKSGLPSSILAQIWGMADMNKDGKMDRKEFSIAMFLIQKKLQGFTLPPALPEHLKQDPGGATPAAAPMPAYGTYGPGMMAPHGPSPMMQQPPMMPPMQPGGTWPRMGGPMPQMAPMAPMAPMGPMQPLPGIMSGQMSPASPALSTPPPAAMPASPRRDSKSTGGVDWEMPPQSRLKYSQLFSTLDNGIGYLTGVHARNILSQSGLSNQQLAQIWGLSDLDKDGKLTLDEFCIAMFMVEMSKAGHILPSSTPDVLVGPAMGRTRTVSSSSGGGAEDKNLSDSMDQKSFFASFEDRRKANFDKGQAELERRRQILQDQEKRERDERERKERELQEQRERERLEAERRRQLEMEKQMARQREFEMHQQEEQRKMLEQREAARREMERQRQLEMERQRIRDLTDQRQRVQEGVCHTKQKQKNLTFQLQALSEKSTEMNQQITDMRDKIVGVTGDIETMKSSRDTKLQDIERLKYEIQQSQDRLNFIGQEKHNVNQQQGVTAASSTVAESYSQVLHSFKNKQANMERLQQSLVEVEADLKQKRTFAEDRQNHLHSLKNSMQQVVSKNRQIYDKLVAKQREAQALVAQHQAASQQQMQNHVQEQAAPAPTQNAWAVNDNAWGQAEAPSTGGSSGFDDNFANWGDQKHPSTGAQQAKALLPQHQSTGQHGASTVRYKAVYEFAARSEDELSFQPGDIILVFKDHAAEPGWLAGQIRDKVGWFPEAFAETIEDGGAPAANEEVTSPTSPTSMPSKLPIVPEEGDTSQSHNAVNGAIEETVAATTTTAQAAAPSTEKGKYLMAAAQYPWKAKKDTHLAFQKGDLIKILEQQEMWWHGELNGATGWFPKSYVKLVDAPRLHGGDQPTVSEERQPSPTKSLSPTKSIDQPTAQGEWYISQYPFAAPEPGDLGFGTGERIWVTSQDSDWWTGTIGDRTGIFPATYLVKEGQTVQSPVIQTQTPVASAPAAEQSPPKEEQPEVGKVIAPFSAAAPNQLHLQPGDLVSVRTKSPSGWWEGERSRPGEERQSGWFPGNYVKMLSTGAGSKSPVSVTGSTASAGSAGEQLEALFDYTAQQKDELSFNRGDTITLMEKEDQDWWRGKLADGSSGLFPANYVQSSCAPRAAPGATRNKKCSMHAQELIDTELHYLQELHMVRRVFRGPFERFGLSKEDLNQIFINWDQLITVSKNLHRDLAAQPLHKVGTVMLGHINNMRAFVAFCKKQQNASDLLDKLEKGSPQFRAMHTKCSQDGATKGLPLSHFLLLPMTRVTKYPLVIDKVVKYTEQKQEGYKELIQAQEKLRSLCSEVNNAVTKSENLQMLHWCQTQIKCESLKPKFVFNSQTNCAGPRQFEHSGILYKAKSNRLLIALLFSDILLLTSPEDSIDEPDSFKLTKTSELTLTLYKSPLLLHKCALQVPAANTGNDDEARLIAISSGDDVIQFRATTTNARILWCKQLDKAIKAARESVQQLAAVEKVQPSGRGLGRIMIELVCVRQLKIPDEFGPNPTVLCRMKLQQQQQTMAVDLKKTDTLCITQFIVSSRQAHFTLSLFIGRVYSPDLCVGKLELPVLELIESSGSHRGPILKQLPLGASELDTGQQDKSYVIIKFVVQLLDD